MNTQFNIKQMLKMFDSKATGFIVIGLSYEYAEISKTFAQTIGLADNQFDSRKDFYECLDQDDVEKLENKLNYLEDGKCDEVYIYLRFPRPKEFPVWTRAFLRLVDIGNGITAAIGYINETTADVANRLLVQTCLDGTYFVDLQNNIAAFSGDLFNSEDEFKKNFSNPHAALRKVFLDNTIDEDVETYIEHVDSLVSTNKQEDKSEFRVYGPDKEAVWISNRGKIYYDDEDEPSLYVGGYINIDNMSVYNRHVLREAQVSQVTRCPNRYRLMEDLDNLLANLDSFGYVFMLVVNNFNDFKNTYDYSVSNRFLEVLTNEINASLLGKSKLYHYEGNCFIIVSEEMLENTAIHQIKKILEIANKPFVFKNDIYPYRLSVSATAFPEFGDSAQEVVHNGEIAIQHIMGSKKISYTFFNEKLFQNCWLGLKRDTEIRNSVFNGMEGFFLEYQPFVDCITGECIGAEALIRWRNSEGDVLLPDKFIPMLERMEMMDVLGNWVIEKVVEQCAKWIDAGFGCDFYISANINVAQLADPEFYGNILQMLRANGLSAKNLMLELTEGTFMEDFDLGIKQISELREFGVQFAIDDFGTGYSSLGYLQTLPVDAIKIDKSFVKNIVSSSKARNFINTIINVVDCIHKKIIVEGIESQEQVSILRQMNVDVFQGFYFNGSLSEEVFEKLYKPNGISVSFKG